MTEVEDSANKKTKTGTDQGGSFMTDILPQIEEADSSKKEVFAKDGTAVSSSSHALIPYDPSSPSVIDEKDGLKKTPEA